jgi:hypothetical protein
MGACVFMSHHGSAVQNRNVGRSVANKSFENGAEIR